MGTGENGAPQLKEMTAAGVSYEPVGAVDGLSDDAMEHGGMRDLASVRQANELFCYSNYFLILVLSQYTVILSVSIYCQYQYTASINILASTNILARINILPVSVEWQYAQYPVPGILLRPTRYAIAL